MSKCKHNPYWIGNYGTCMACRAEQAEQLASEQQATISKLEEKLAAAGCKDLQKKLANDGEQVMCSCVSCKLWRAVVNCGVIFAAQTEGGKR